jgi:hypothetical protein
MPTDRSKPLFPTYGPDDGSGRDWHQYFTELKRSSHVEVDPADDADSDSVSEPITVVIPATEVPEDWFNVGAPQSLRTWRNRLLANDWTYKCGASQAWHDDRYYLNGNLDSPAHFEEVWWINAIKDGVYITISFTLRGDKVYSAHTARRVRGEMKNYGDKEFKAIVEGTDD